MARRSGRGVGIAGLALASIALLLTGYVLPADRVVGELMRLRSRASPVRVQVRVERPGTGQQETVQIDLHPTGGWRIRDDRGTRWIGRGPSVTQGPVEPPPGGLDAAWLMVISREGSLRSYLARLGVDLDRNQLGRCGRDDCFVLGGRGGPAQLWIEKERLDVRKLRDRKGQEVEFEGYREGVGSVRMPTVLRVRDPLGAVAEVAVVEFEGAPELSDDPEIGG